MEISYEKAVFWYYSNIVRKKRYSRRFVQEIYYHSVAMNLSVYLYFFWGGGMTGTFFVSSFVVDLPSDSISPLFYIQLSYVAIKDDFCKNSSLLTCFRVACYSLLCLCPF